LIMSQQSNTISEKISELKSAPVKEGGLTRSLENQTAKLPSIGYLGLAIGSMAVSAGLLLFAERKTWANFVGLWAPSFLLIGVYNKLVKIEHELV